MSSPLPSPLDEANLRARVQVIVDRTMARQSGPLLAVSADTAPLLEALEVLLAGGKRLRPAFCYWGFRAAGGDAGLEDTAMTCAASLEFLQACALIHDDVMDGSDTRRGQPAAHRRFAHLHRGAGYLGDPEAFGVGAAILLGDLCLSWADDLLYRSGMPADALARAKDVYDTMRTELMAGQYLDLLEQARGGGSVDRALTVTRYKTAKYTIERPLHMGARLAGADDALCDALSAYALPLGSAFQLRDDVMGVFGDPAETGKPAGDDLREGKRTVLVALATESATPAEAETLRALLGDPRLDAAGIEQLRAIITGTGALARTEAMIEEMLAEALSALEFPGIDDQSRAILTQLAFAATRRTA